MSGKYRILSMFSNVGIAETYFKDIGVHVAVANELLPQRNNSQKTDNHRIIFDGKRAYEIFIRK